VFSRKGVVAQDKDAGFLAEVFDDRVPRESQKVRQFLIRQQRSIAGRGVCVGEASACWPRAFLEDRDAIRIESAAELAAFYGDGRVACG